MLHMDSRDYNEARSDAARKARVIMQETIDKGRASAERTIATVMRDVPQDYLIRARALQVNVAGGRVSTTIPGTGGTHQPVDFSKHAFNQLCEAADMPIADARDLLTEKGDWGQQLLAHNLRERMTHADDGKKLVRVVGGQVRGVLSDSYKRLDSRPLVEAFCGAASKAGLVPVMGHATETRVALKALLPVVFEPAPNEIMTFGLEWENSDFGAGAHSCRVFMMRVWCTNMAIMERAMRQIHLGKKLDDVAFSSKTYQLEAQAQASALGDIVSSALAPERVGAYCDVIAQASAEKIDAGKELAKLKALTKGERTTVAEAFNSPDVEMMPAGNTLWRLSNAISWVAQKADGDDRRLELEKIAGDVLPLKAA